MTSRSNQSLTTALLSAALLLGLTACGNSDDAPAVIDSSAPTLDVQAQSKQTTLDVPALTDETAQDAFAAVLGASEIPYPVYPNGTKYRVGGENGLKIVVFETTDSFEAVDAFYSSLSKETGMPRLLAMTDYVRYSTETADIDPWATYRPGIVIHDFNGDDERDAVGASVRANTNIIMSF